MIYCEERILFFGVFGFFLLFVGNLKEYYLKYWKYKEIWMMGDFFCQILNLMFFFCLDLGNGLVDVLE